MTNALISALIEKKAFAKDTIITARYRSVDLFGRIFDNVGQFKVRRILNVDNKLMFELFTAAGNMQIIKVRPEEIKAVDGMDIIRYADIYDIQPDGSIKKVGRKRGRKPKNQLTM